MLRDIRILYLQTTELFCMGGTEYQEGILTYDLLRESRAEFDTLVNYAGLRSAEGMEEILFELYLISCKMKLRGYPEEKKRKIYQWIQNVFDGTPDSGTAGNGTENIGSEWELLRDTAKFMVRQKAQGVEQGREEKRMDQILLAVFEHLPEQELNIRYLAKEILFMNEDYFSRLFRRYKKVKFSAYLLKVRINLARRILQYSPDSRVSDVAGMVGFPGDGQYFSKVFRRETGMTPTQYREAGSDE